MRSIAMNSFVVDFFAIVRGLARTLLGVRGLLPMGANVEITGAKRSN